MFDVQDFLDRAKAGAHVTSDYALCVKVLGYKDQATMSNWRKGRSKPDERAIVRLCELTGDDPAVIAASIQAERAATDEAAALWRQIAARLAAVPTAKIAVLFALVLVAQMFGGTDAAAAGALLLGSMNNAIIVSICLLVAVAHRTLATTFYALRPRLFRAHADT